LVVQILVRARVGPLVFLVHPWFRLRDYPYGGTDSGPR